jgi:polyisoprenoid-binding protein YceI
MYLENNKLKGRILFILCAFACIPFANAQARYKVTTPKDCLMKLTGTSTLHDWEMNTQLVNGDALFNFAPTTKNQAPTLPFLNFSLTVLNLKSDNKGLDNNAYKALKTEAFKLIYYKLSSTTITTVSETKYLLHTKGNLTIAGVTKQIEMEVNCLVNKDGSITCSGSYSLNMTEYNITPPSFMMGAMKTGDNVSLAFTIIYQKT